LEGNDSVYTFRPFGDIGAGVRIMVTDVRQGKNGPYEVRIIGWRAGAVVADDWRQIGPKSVKLGNTGPSILALQHQAAPSKASAPAQHGLTRRILRGLPASWTRTVRREAVWTWVLELTVNFLVPSVAVYFGADYFGEADPGRFVRAFMPAWGALFLVMHGRRQSLGLAGTALLLTAAYGGAASAFLLGGWWIGAGIAVVAIAGVYHAKYDIPDIAKRRRDAALRILSREVSPEGQLEKVFPKIERPDLEQLFPSRLKGVTRQDVIDLFADAQADLLIDSGAVVNGQWVVNATEPQGEMERDLLNALVNAMARRSAVTRITVLFRDNVPRDDAAVLRRFPEAKGKLDPRWATQTTELNATEADERGHKLSAKNCLKNLNLPEIKIYSLVPSDVTETNELAQVLGLENLVRASREVWEALQRYALVSENA
jgi:hypothetical protein